MNNKVKIISILTLLTLAIMLCVIVCLPSNEIIRDKLQIACNHVDSNIDMKCDKCHAILPYKNYLEAQKLNAISEDNTIAQISGNMPKNTNAQISNIDQAEAINIANKHINISNEDIVGAYNISLNTKTNAQTNNSTNTSEVKYQPEKLNQSVNVELSNVSIDLDKQYVMLHILDNNNYELIPIEKLSENKISFKAKSFSTYMLITVEGYQVTFTGENYKVYDGYGREITDGITIASGTDFKFTIEANAGYGITTVTSSAGTLELKGYTKMKTAKIAAVNQNITIDVTTVSEPKIVTGPESTKVKVGDTATFSVVAENTTTYQWQYRDVGEEGFTNVETNGTSETLSVVVTETMSGREYRCLIENSEFANNERIESDVASLFIASDDITNKVVVKDLNEILPKITTQPVSQKIKLGDTATFTVVAENATMYSWQYKTNNTTDDWKKVDSNIGTSLSIASGYDTSSLTIDTSVLEINEETLKIANDISGYIFRCVVTNEEMLSQVATSDSVFLSVTQDDINLDNIVYADYKIESTGIYYETLEKAIAAAVAGDKIIVIDDVDDISNAVVNKNLTIDTNGYTITKEEITIMVNENVLLNIIGNGKITGGTECHTIHNKGILTLNDATIENTCGNETYKAISTSGTLVINSGTVTSSGTTIYNTGKLEIKDGKILAEGSNTGTIYAILQGATADLKITGGEISAKNDAGKVRTILYRQGNMTVSNATLKGEANDSSIVIESWSNSAVYAGQITINEGTIIESTSPTQNAYGISITGEGVALDIGIKMNGGEITSNGKIGVGIYEKSNGGKIEILGGTITASTRGIEKVDTTGELIIGEVTHLTNKTNPTISGGAYGVYAPDGFEFNNGIIKGTNAIPYEGTATPSLNDLFVVEVSGPENGVYSAYLDFDDSISLITEWTIPAGIQGTIIKLPIPSQSSNNYVVDWGDGSEDHYTTESCPTHTYENTSEKTYTIRIVGKVNQFGYVENDAIEANGTGTNSDYYTFTKYLTGLKAWGELGAMRYGFSQCTNLASTIPAPMENSFKSITDMSNLFYNCGALNGEIPTDFFKQATEALKFDRTFSGCKLLNGTIPVDLFAANTKVTSFVETFKDCILLSGSIPEALFSNNTEVTDFTGTFENCKTLSESVPAGLFTANTKVTTFASTFKGCMNLTGTIPANLFTTNVLVKDFSNTFNGCNKLSGLVPGGLFKKNKLANNFTSTFEGCSNITACELQVSTTVVTQMDNMFKDCTALESIVLSKDFKNITGSDMFLNTSALRAIILLQQAETEAEIGTISNMSDLGLAGSTVIYVPYKEQEALHKKVWTNIPAENIQKVVQIVPPNPDYVELNAVYEDPGYTVAGFNMHDEAIKYTQYGFYVEVRGMPVDTSELGSEWIKYILRRD